MASFCKLMIDDDHFTSKLRIPPEFVNNYGEIFTKFKKMMTLRIDDDDESGKMWRVGIKQTGDFHFFNKGWTKFAQDVDLQVHDFLIFKLFDESAFHVSIYDTTACNKLDSSYSENGDDSDNEVKNGGMGSNAERWRFSMELKNHHFKTQRMCIPKTFAVGTGIAKNGAIKVQDDKGRQWPIKVTYNRRYGMTGGWKRFVVANEAVIGSIVSFEFIGGSSNLVRAVVINNGSNLKNEKSI